MRTLLFLGLVIGAAFMANWFTIERDGERTRIDINRDEIRSDAQHAIEKGREILDKRERERHTSSPPVEGYGPDAGYGPAAGNWPASGSAQNTGYSAPGTYGNPPAYSDQSYPVQPTGGQPAGGQAYGGQAYGGQAYGGQNDATPSPPRGYGPTYPASAGNPPPWQR